MTLRGTSDTRMMCIPYAEPACYSKTYILFTVEIKERSRIFGGWPGGVRHVNEEQGNILKTCTPQGTI